MYWIPFFILLEHCMLTCGIFGNPDRQLIVLIDGLASFSLPAFSSCYWTNAFDFDFTIMAYIDYSLSSNNYQLAKTIYDLSFSDNNFLCSFSGNY